jgi:adenylate cyclase
MIALAALRMIDPPPLEELRLRTFDFFQLAAPREASAHPAVIVDIDEESLKALGQWPWPRTVIADLVDRLAGLGAAAIGFDVIFAEPDRYSPAPSSISCTISTSRAANAFAPCRATIRSWLRRLAARVWCSANPP